MSYQIIIPKPVQKQLDSLPKIQRDRAITAVRSLTNEPRPTGVKKLKGYDETYRIRFGDYRVIYKRRTRRFSPNDIMQLLKESILGK